MARKEETKIVHPRQALAALTAYNNDVGTLMAAVRNAISFLSDDTLDQAKVGKAIVPTLKDASDKVSRWYDAE